MWATLCPPPLSIPCDGSPSRTSAGFAVVNLFLLLASLLARRDQVRTTQTAPAPEARPELFKPVQTVVLPSRPGTGEGPDLKLDISEPEKPAAGAGQKPESTTSRLLDAKRKAQRKKD